MNQRENLLRAYRFEKPDTIPIAASFWALWFSDEYDPSELEDLMLTHPRLYPGYVKGQGVIDPKTYPLRPDLIKGKPYTDGWGAVWKTHYQGMVGAVVEHPLSDWGKWETFGPPDIETSDGMLPIDWEKLRQAAEPTRQAGYAFQVGLPHGHTFLRLQDLRGYENLMMDMMLEEPRLPDLIRMVEAFNLRLIERFIQLKPDVICIPEDLGMQTSPMISPDLFRKYIKPSYCAIMKPIKEAGIVVHEHSDGYIMDLIDDLIDAGSEVINMQDLVNGIDAIAKHVKGRMAIDLDIDRQNITVTGTPREIDDHIKEIVCKLGSPQGGLSMVYQAWTPTPVANVRAVLDAMEKYCTYYQ